MAFTNQQMALSRTPVTLVVLTLDTCGRTFSVAPCAATGAPCFQTFHTCKYRSAYLLQQKTYKFTSYDSPLPFPGPIVRPYLKSVKYLATEIKDNLTVNGRATVEFIDEPDTDVGIDPYVGQRQSVQGTFWKKLLARNPNYKGRTVAIYEGFLGDPEAEYRQRWTGTIDTIKFGKDTVSIEVIDLLKPLNEVFVPPKAEIKLRSDLAEATTIKTTWTSGRTFTAVGDYTALWTEDQKLNILRDNGNEYQFTLQSVALSGTDTTVTVKQKFPTASPFLAGKKIKNTTTGQQTTLYTNWSSGQLLVATGDYTAAWLPGDALEVYRKNGTKFAATIASVALNSGNTNVTIVEAFPAGNFVAGASVRNIDRGGETDEIYLVAGDDNALLTGPGYVRIDDEIIAYEEYDADQVKLFGLTRGVDGTTPANHNKNAAVQIVRRFPQENLFDRMKTLLLEDAGLSASYVDTAAFDYWRDWPLRDIDFPEVFVSEPEQLDKLLLELVDLMDCKLWVAEDLKVTIRRNMPNEPGRAYTYLSDAQNIIAGSCSIDLNPESRISRYILRWDLRPLADPKEPASYQRLDIGIDPTSETAEEYNEIAEKEVLCRWLRPYYIQDELLQAYIRGLVMRHVIRSRDALPILSLEVEQKDSDIATGSWARISTDELVTPDGKPLENVPFQITKRDPKGNRIALKALRVSQRKWAIIAPDDVATNYADAPAADTEYAYQSNDLGRLDDHTDGYYQY